MVMLVAALVGSVNNEISKNREKSKAKYLEIKKKARRFTKPNIKKGKYLERLCRRIIRNVMRLRFQRRWLKLIRILLLRSA